MFLGNIEQVVHEQHKDRIHQVELAQLLKQLGANEEQPNVWQLIKERWRSHSGQEKATIGKLVEKTA